MAFRYKLEYTFTEVLSNSVIPCCSCELQYILKLKDPWTRSQNIQVLVLLRAAKWCQTWSKEDSLAV